MVSIEQRRGAFIFVKWNGNAIVNGLFFHEEFSAAKYQLHGALYLAYSYCISTHLSSSLCGFDILHKMYWKENMENDYFSFIYWNIDFKTCNGFTFSTISTAIKVTFIFENIFSAWFKVWSIEFQRIKRVLHNHHCYVIIRQWNHIIQRFTPSNLALKIFVWLKNI